MGNVCSPKEAIIEETAVETELRVLLLGAGDTGKSTIFKQISILQNEGFDDQLFQDYILHVRMHTLRGMRALSSYALKHNVPFDAEENKKCANELQILSDLDVESQWSVMSAKIASLWADSAIKSAYDIRNEFQIEENGSYFFDNLSRVSQDSYRPTQVDVLMTRVKTLGVTEKMIHLEGDKKLKIVDVGGQRTERKKWFSLFETCCTILYLVSLSDYNQKCYEDDDTNRMMENYKLFCDVINNKYFTDKPVIVIFNKLDVFENKMKKKRDHIGLAFPEYNDISEDHHNVDVALQFLEKKFKEARDASDYDYGPIYTFTSKAIDTESLRGTIEQVKSIILKYGLKQQQQ
jgi:GTPase SAR1 family protein